MAELVRNVCITLNMGDVGERYDELFQNDMKAEKDLMVNVKACLIKTHKNHHDMARDQMLLIKENVFGMADGKGLFYAHPIFDVLANQTRPVDKNGVCPPPIQFLCIDEISCRSIGTVYDLILIDAKESASHMQCTMLMNQSTPEQKQVGAFLGKHIRHHMHHMRHCIRSKHVVTNRRTLSS